MTTSWLILLPLAAAIVLFATQKLRFISVLLATATLSVMAIFVRRVSTDFSLIVLGRSLTLTSQGIAALVLCYGLVICGIIYSYLVPETDLSYTFILLAMGFLSAAVMTRNLAIAILLLEAGIIVTATLVPGRHPRSALAAMRALVLLVIASLFLLLAAWAIESHVGTSQNLFYVRLASISLALGVGVILPLFPFHIWLPPVLRYGSVLAIITTTVILNVVAFTRISELLVTTPWSGAKDFFASLLLGSGLITTVMGGIMALPQQSLHRVLVFSALAEGGLALAGLAIGTDASVRAATYHTVFRAIGVTTVALALGIFRTRLQGDEVQNLKGALRRTPLAVTGLIVGGFSLVGLPLTAGFTSRFLLYQALATRDMTWAVIALAASVGPAVAFVRCTVSALTPTSTSFIRYEPILPGIIIALLSILLLVLGIQPQFVTLLFPSGPS